jgi:hypothetical protein
MHWVSCRKDRHRSAFFRGVAVKLCAIALGTALAVGVAKNAAAMSEYLVWIEHVVTSTTANRAVFTEFLIVDDRTLLEAMREGSSDDAVVNASFGIENGASILSFSPPEKLGENENYLPLDVEVSFSRPGVFMGHVELAIQLGDRTLVETQHFWVRHDGITSSFISYLEYIEGRRREAVPIKADPANIEDGDVPGEGIKGPHECDPNRGTNWGARCGF